MSDTTWNTNYPCTASSTFDQTDPSSMPFPTINSRQAHENYPSPASSISSPSRTAQQDSTVSQDHNISNTQDLQTNDCYSSSFVDPGSVDHDGRPLSGRLSRLEYRGQRRRDGIQSPYPRTSSALSPRHYPPLEGSASRPQSPICSREDQYGLSVAPPAPMMVQNQSYRPLSPNTLTPNSLMPYPSFDHQYSSHTQGSTASHAYDHRPPSPALSTVSSRSDHGHRDTPGVPRDSPERDVPSLVRPKPKKAKLTNALRKEICLHQQQHPHQKQEEIAQRFGVERSTVSKILKEKKTWLNIEDGVAEPPRHRPPKHPKLEEEMLQWLEDLSEAGETITDAKIQKKALEIADELRKKYGTIGSEKGKDKDESFKASAGWIENFKRRHHVKGGVWHGRPKPEDAEVEDAPMTSEQPDVMHTIPEEQYIHHDQSEITHPMEVEDHPDDVPPADDVPREVPSKQEAERAYHILTHYLDANVVTLEPLGYKHEHRDALHEMYNNVFFKTSPLTS